MIFEDELDLLGFSEEENDHNQATVKRFRERQYFELENFTERFRLTREQVELLVNQLGDLIGPNGHMARNHPLSALDKVLLALRHRPGYNLSNFSNPFTPEDDANNFMDLPEFMKVSSLDIHLRKSLGKTFTVPFDASRPQISEEDICLWLHANPNSQLVPRKMDIVIFYLNPAFIVKLVKMVSEIFSASTNFCPFDLTLKRRRYLDQDILDRKGIAAGLTQDPFKKLDSFQMTSPLLDQYQLEDVVQFIALKREPGLRTKLHWFLFCSFVVGWQLLNVALLTL
ncbi:hypothetical protein DdX_16009 [Ditylenchus destructor]|uniref:Uncharacterized protein n=1 Tax=Ditylenchus destructor TaxID=166010 RepID=A0AAD4MPB2_9BILA|nr:hypothetical protein DdX_16009 [Ditylenchus destructor]